MRCMHKKTQWWRPRHPHSMCSMNVKTKRQTALQATTHCCQRDKRNDADDTAAKILEHKSSLGTPTTVAMEPPSQLASLSTNYQQGNKARPPRQSSASQPPLSDTWLDTQSTNYKLMRPLYTTCLAPVRHKVGRCKFCLDILVPVRTANLT
jgi:hypothetical protein